MIKHQLHLAAALAIFMTMLGLASAGRPLFGTVDPLGAWRITPMTEITNTGSQMQVNNFWGGIMVLAAMLAFIPFVILSLLFSLIQMLPRLYWILSSPVSWILLPPLVWSCLLVGIAYYLLKKSPVRRKRVGPSGRKLYIPAARALVGIAPSTFMAVSACAQTKGIPCTVNPCQTQDSGVSLLNDVQHSSHKSV